MAEYDIGFFAARPDRHHFARLLADGTLCVVRLYSHHQGESPVLLRTYGQGALPEGEAACAAMWLRLTRG